MSFRVTWIQALARGAWWGAVIGAAGSVAALAAVAGSVLLGLGSAGAAWLVVATPLVAGPSVGAGYALVRWRGGGVDIDDRGVYLVPSDGPEQRPACVPWRRISDVRPERRGGRLQVAMYTDTGQYVRLSAPYDGRLLAHDPAFERKLFMMRNLWETHRSFAVHRQRSAGEARSG